MTEAIATRRGFNIEHRSAAAQKKGVIWSSLGSGTTGAIVNAGDVLGSSGNEYCIRIDAGNSNVLCNPYHGNNEGQVDDMAPGANQVVESVEIRADCAIV